MLLLFTMSPQTVAILKLYGVIGAVFVGVIVLWVLFQSFMGNMQRLGRVLAMVWESDGTITSELCKPFFKGEHHVIELDGQLYFIDDAARYQRSFPGNSMPVIGPLMNNNIATYCYRRGVANPMAVAPVNRAQQPILSSLSLMGFMNHSFMFEGTKFVDWYEKAAALAQGNPKAVVIIGVITLIAIVGLAAGMVFMYQNLTEIHRAIIGVAGG